ncbi:hypothetical protein WICMUC_002785 [Wickerhamomyces mucosus]|uniref:Uncharacterized protein n=1 Tax=Wickerhamomyces mucosus TaxID=1378264 RepID=A0A9P8PPG0_9ASCO|nr:hypothetical protein WICMUC_002785 [Wickerhamomyces mucosus]
MNFQRSGNFQQLQQHNLTSQISQQQNQQQNQSLLQGQHLQQTQNSQQLSNNSNGTNTASNKLRQQLQPLSVSQLSNLQQAQQQVRDAQLARAKLNSSKSFNLEDDLEFCPNQIEISNSPSFKYPSLSGINSTQQLFSNVNNATNSNRNSRFQTSSLKTSSSPYNTPTKNNPNNTNGLHRINSPIGFMSPVASGTLNSPPPPPQQQQHHRHYQNNNEQSLYTSPQTQGILRRVDGSPIYGITPQKQQQQQQQQYQHQLHSRW